jgi:hypothetical protein
MTFPTIIAKRTHEFYPGIVSNFLVEPFLAPLPSVSVPVFYPDTRSISTPYFFRPYFFSTPLCRLTDGGSQPSYRRMCFPSVTHEHPVFPKGAGPSTFVTAHFCRSVTWFLVFFSRCLCFRVGFCVLYFITVIHSIDATYPLTTIPSGIFLHRGLLRSLPNRLT